MSTYSLAHATLGDLLAEIERRFQAGDAGPKPAPPGWAAPVVEQVASYYELTYAQLRGPCRQQSTVRARDLAVSLLAHLHPLRSQAEIGAVFHRGHEICGYARAKTDALVARNAAFGAEVSGILAALSTDGHCRTSPQGTRACGGESAPSATSAPTPP